jgi:hypothetical protein
MPFNNDCIAGTPYIATMMNEELKSAIRHVMPNVKEFNDQTLLKAAAMGFAFNVVYPLPAHYRIIRDAVIGYFNDQTGL